MKNFSAFKFTVLYLPSQPRITCKFITAGDEAITIHGNTIQEIYDRCVNIFPNGIKIKGIYFVNDNPSVAKMNFCALISLGLKTGYFTDSDFIKYESEEDGLV